MSALSSQAASDKTGGQHCLFVDSIFGDFSVKLRPVQICHSPRHAAAANYVFWRSGLLHKHNKLLSAILIC